MNNYNKQFYDSMVAATNYAAREILREIHSYHSFQSVVDVGCGAGIWLNAAGELTGNEKTLLGIDGIHAKEFISQKKYQFHFQNLEAPLEPKGKFDLALCLEVAEHLTPNRGDALVRELCEFSDVVLFSAAIPGQGGTDHINEQWQSYWFERFQSLGFDCFEPFDRGKFWHEKNFKNCIHYLSNCFLYCKKDSALATKLTPKRISSSSRMDIVHPQTFQTLHPKNAKGFDLIKLGLKKLLKIKTK